MRAWIAVATLASMVTLTGQTPAPRPAAFDVVEATITQMQRAMAEHRLTSRELVTQYLNRIALYDKGINAAISINPHALEEADARDRERAAGRVRGPLHGIPIALKDNIHTIDIRTTGGALAFANFTPPYDATLTKNLREAGAVIIAKTVLTELANWVSGAPTPMPGNYSAVGGFSFNPYDPRPDPRESSDGRPVMSTGGSSSGAGTAANFWAASVGIRHRRIGRQPGDAHDARRPAADDGPHQPSRHHSDHGRSGHRRADGADGDRRGDSVRRARERVARPGRRRDIAVHAAAGARLHEVPEVRPDCAARASAFRARTTTSACRSRSGREPVDRGGRRAGAAAAEAAADWATRRRR